MATKPESLKFVGKLEGHTDWVTSIATTMENSDMIITGSRDKRLIVWDLSTSPEEGISGTARRSMTGHSQAISDVVISSDGQFALTASWDKTLRLFDINSGRSVRTFAGHTKDVYSVAFSTDNRQIVSAGRDCTLKLWNTLGECKYTLTEDKHTDWVSCVRFSPSTKQPLIVSCGWDKLVKVWSLTACNLKYNLAGHSGVLHNVTISPDGSLCASGGKDGTSMLWDVNEGKHLYSLDAESSINVLCFSPKNYWLAAATDSGIRVWDLENKTVLQDVTPEKMPNGGLPAFVSMSWSVDGNKLFAGSADGNVYVYEVSSE